MDGKFEFTKEELKILQFACLSTGNNLNDHLYDKFGGGDHIKEKANQCLDMYHKIAGMINGSESTT